MSSYSELLFDINRKSPKEELILAEEPEGVLQVKRKKDVEKRPVCIERFGQIRLGEVGGISCRSARSKTGRPPMQLISDFDKDSGRRNASGPPLVGLAL